MGYLSPVDLQRLIAKGAVGDILCRYFDAAGEIIDDEVQERVIGIPMQVMCDQTKLVIGVAGGPSKVDAIRGALLKKYINVLITDERTAAKLLRRERAMIKDLSGRVALITGAGRGIGRSIALALAEAGARTFLAARSSDQLERVAGEIRARGGEAEYLAADLSRADGVEAVFSALRQRQGSLDVLVNNAGLGLSGPLVEFPVESLDLLLAVNVKGLFLCCQQAMRLMAPARRGYIINISSVVGVKGYANQAAYAASKHAVMGITKSLAAEAQPHGIRVSAILPGGVDTSLMEALRPDLDKALLMKPDDIADAVMFLLSLSDSAAVDEIYIRRRSSAPF